MKYIKTYEDKFTNVHKPKEQKPLDIEIGDYVVIDHNILDEDDKIVIRKDYPYQIINIEPGNIISYICDDGLETTDVYSIEYKKISKEEAEFLINANKYNL